MTRPSTDTVASTPQGSEARSSRMLSRFSLLGSRGSSISPAIEPLVYQLEVAMIDSQSNRRLSIFGATGTPWPVAFVDRIRVYSEALVEKAPPALLDEGQRLTLIDYSLSQRTWRAEESIDFTLQWATAAPLPSDYQTYVHLRVSAAAEPVAHLRRDFERGARDRTGGTLLVHRPRNKIRHRAGRSRDGVCVGKHGHAGPSSPAFSGTKSCSGVSAAFSEEAGFNLYAGRDVVTNPTQLLNLYQNDGVDLTAMLAMLDEQAFDTVIFRAQFYPPPVLDMIGQRYETIDLIAMNGFVYCIMEPRSS